MRNTAIRWPLQLERANGTSSSFRTNALCLVGSLRSTVPIKQTINLQAPESVNHPLFKIAHPDLGIPPDAIH